MSGARCARADDLRGDRQIGADDAILEKSNSVVFEQAGDNAGQRRIEKGARALCIFSHSERFLLGEEHWNMGSARLFRRAR